ncbi:hypothetical protein FD755_023461 [Muntiacus reevesi]|uniref:Uncharacterized protein n=1 Tax=Muntiacus reevesi TaxID=9886 RepID=A0A5N3VWU6_MUNRE|nr:hypothetical protein FD755_023461 [Muntiacus reevesi]
MEAADPGAGRGGVAGDAEGQGGLDGPGDPNGPEGHEGLGGAGEAGAAVAGAPELVQAPHAPGPGGDAMPGPGGHAAPGPGGHVAPGSGVHGALGPGGHARLWTLGHAASGHGGCGPPVARGPRSQLLNFSIVVSFPSPMEAEMARQSLSPHAQPYRRAVGKELTVNCSILAMLVYKGAWVGGRCLGSF